MAFLGVGPTELRILMAAGAIALITTPTVNVVGVGTVRLWDLGGVIGALGMAGAFLIAAIRNIRALYIEETHAPPRPAPATAWSGHSALETAAHVEVDR